jgi:hypothetical protein
MDHYNSKNIWIAIKYHECTRLCTPNNLSNIDFSKMELYTNEAFQTDGKKLKSSCHSKNYNKMPLVYLYMVLHLFLESPNIYIQTLKFSLAGVVVVARRMLWQRIARCGNPNSLSLRLSIWGYMRKSNRRK